MLTELDKSKKTLYKRLAQCGGLISTIREFRRWKDREFTYPLILSKFEVGLDYRQCQQINNYQTKSNKKKQKQHQK